MKKFIVIHLSERYDQCVQIFTGKTLKDIIVKSWSEEEDFCEMAALVGVDIDEYTPTPEEFYDKVIEYIKEDSFSDGDEIIRVYDITDDIPIIPSEVK